MRVPPFRARWVYLAVGIVVLSMRATTFGEGPAPGTAAIEPHAFEAPEWGQRIEADWGHLYVPERHGRPGGAVIELAFVRFRSTAEHPGPPIVYLAGGPGASGIDLARGLRFPMFMALREVADVIVLDQRGVGHSQPCLDYYERWDFPLDQPGDPEHLNPIIREKARGCLEFWRARGVDLAAYNTIESADDVNALRTAIGADTISLWGTSYGTHLALAIIRRHGDVVHRAVFSGVEGPDHTLKLPSTTQSALERLDRLCREDPEVQQWMPDLLGVVRKMLERLAESPVTVETRDPLEGADVRVVIGEFDLRRWTAEAVGRLDTLARIPGMYARLEAGDFSALAPDVLASRKALIGSAMGLMMDVSSGASRERRTRIEHESSKTLLGDAVNAHFAAVWEGLGKPDLGPEFRTSIRSNIPVLFISGELDARTPVENAEEVRAGFRNGATLIVCNTGHDEGLFSLAPGVREAMIAFLKGEPLPFTQIDHPPPQFERPALHNHE